MLEWHHDRRATAQQMLDHPWLNMPANYDYKYIEMNELVESDPEDY
jgi:hypothetical protein